MRCTLLPPLLNCQTMQVQVVLVNKEGAVVKDFKQNFQVLSLTKANTKK